MEKRSKQHDAVNADAAHDVLKSIDHPGQSRIAIRLGALNNGEGLAPPADWF